MTAQLLSTCDELVDLVDDPVLHAELERARRTLREPLRIGVVGRVKAGKSTLVNALLGQRVAPTAVTECTRVVTWYRHGRPATAEVVRHDGRREHLPFVDGLPDTLGVALEDVARVEVQLPAASLRGRILVDTPGLASATAGLEQRTRGTLLGEAGSRAATGELDAILFVFRDTERRDELDVVEAFRSACGHLGGTPLNAIGVLSHADTFGAGGHGDTDPTAAAREHAARLAREHRGLFADVVAVTGLLAETARTGRCTEQHAGALRRLEGLDDARLQLWRRFRDDVHALGVTDGAVRELEQALGTYGLRHARAVAAAGLGAVHAWCERSSGLETLETVLDVRFGRRADVLKASRVLSALERLVHDDRLEVSARARLADSLERVHLDPALHRVRELRSTELLRRRGDRDDEVLQALERLLASDDPRSALGATQDASPGEIRRRALDRAAWAAGVAATASPDLELAEAGRVLSRSYLLLAEQAGARRTD